MIRWLFILFFFSFLNHSALEKGRHKPDGVRESWMNEEKKPAGAASRKAKRLTRRGGQRTVGQIIQEYLLKY